MLYIRRSYNEGRKQIENIIFYYLYETFFNLIMSYLIMYVCNKLLKPLHLIVTFINISFLKNKPSNFI